MGLNVYEMVTNKIIEKLEQGVIPWRRPFQSAWAVNWKTQRPYRGINAILLEPGEYATFKQIQEAGGRVKKGEKGHLVVFWKWIEIEDEETGEKKEIPFLRYYKVFEINTQCEGLKSKRKVKEYHHNPIEEAEKIKNNYRGPLYTELPGKAYYRPSDDVINVPRKEEFESIHEYYSTLFHEMVHSTGHPSRLNRKGIAEISPFGSETYSKEELVAELGASFLCNETGILPKTLDNSAAYIQSWLRVLKNDKTLVVKASQQAQKAVDFILGKIPESEDYS